MVEISAPGKLFLSGEWAVLEVGNPGIVAAVDNRVHVDIKESDSLSVSVEDFDIENQSTCFEDGDIHFEDVSKEREERLKFTKSSLKTVLNYLDNFKPFEITSWGEKSQIEVDGEKRKIGFGSSASSTVATIASVMEFHGYDIEDREVRDKIYKLGAISHYFAQGKAGSAFDVAASTYGGIFLYQRFDPDWLVNQIGEGNSVKDIVEKDWPSFKVDPLTVPPDFNLLVAWTGESASTSRMIKKIRKFKKRSPRRYNQIYNEIVGLVKEEVRALETGDRDSFLESLRENEDLLRELGEKSGVDIETSELKKLSKIANRHGAAGKLSGAGGGDCGIGVCFDDQKEKSIREEWSRNDLKVLDVSIDREGIKKH